MSSPILAKTNNKPDKPANEIAAKLVLAQYFC